MEGLQALIASLVALVLPAAEHALGVDAPVAEKQKWVVDGVQDILEHMVFSKLKLPSWAMGMKPQVEELIGKELAKLLAQKEAA